MTEFKCGNCREVFVLSPKARFFPNCGSSSLNLIIKELKEPAQKETLGVYSPSETKTDHFDTTTEYAEARKSLIDQLTDQKEEEDQPRRRRR